MAKTKTTCKEVLINGVPRYVIAFAHNGEIIDDQDGLGYDSAAQARAVHRSTKGDMASDILACRRKFSIEQWLERNSSFADEMRERAASGMFNAATVDAMLKSRSWVTEFAPAEIFDVWKHSGQY